MKTLRIYVATAFVVFMSSFTLAGIQTVPATYIKALRLSSNTGTLYFKTDSAISSINSTCTETDWYAINTDIQEIDLMMSMLLSAQMANRKVILYISTKADDCKENRQRIALVETVNE